MIGGAAPRRRTEVEVIAVADGITLVPAHRGNFASSANELSRLRLDRRSADHGKREPPFSRKDLRYL